MNMTVRKQSSLPQMNIGWLALSDHFVATVGPQSGQGQVFGSLLVAADAVIQPRSSFSLHPHKDMEILTWVASGWLHHRDNLGESAELPAGTLQLMSARDGLVHAEGNIRSEPVRLVQIWIQPSRFGGQPVYETTMANGEDFNLLAAEKNAPLLLRQDVALSVAILNGGKAYLEIPEGCVGYGISIGDLRWNQILLGDGDGIFIKPGALQVEGFGQSLVITQPASPAPSLTGNFS